MLFKRTILNNIEKWIHENEIIVLNGPRQVGKTSLLKLIKEKLIDQGIPSKVIFYLNLEELSILEDLNGNPENLLNYITDNGQKNYFLIDEIQYLDNPSNFLKHIYDKYAEQIKIITTGSSSLELKAELQDSLVGRKVSFLIAPLTFEEYLQFKEADHLRYLHQEDIPQDIKRLFDNDLKDYMIYGGMPAVVLQSDQELKQKMLAEYVGTYINKDIRSIGKIDNISQFNSVIKILASQISQLLNIAELSNTADITRRNVQKYLDLLEHTFVVSKVHSYQANVRTQITKMPEIFFFDLGVRNAILNNYLSIDGRKDKGDLFENFIFLELASNAENKIYFYRTTSKTEIDFVVERADELKLIEVKYKELKNSIDSRVLRGFDVNNNKSKDLFVVSRISRKSDKNVEYIDYRSVDHSLKKCNNLQ